LRDARLEQTIDTCVFYNGRGFTRFNVGMEMTSSTGYGVSKYDNAAIPVNFRNQTSSNYTHCPLFWLSVIYLQYAEASAELSELGGEAITQADLDISINLLRDRAKLPKLNKDVDYKDPKNTIGVSNLIWEIRRERRCELMFDNWTRYWDLIRWHQLDKLDSTKNPDILLGANLSADKEIAKNEKVTLVGNYMDGSKDKTRTFDVKYYLYPIPSGQIDLNPNLAPNNPGW
jgi:SusD family.